MGLSQEGVSVGERFTENTEDLAFCMTLDDCDTHSMIGNAAYVHVIYVYDD